MDKNDFEATVRRLCEGVGLAVLRIDATNGDLGIAEVNVFVRRDDAQEVYAKMTKAEKVLTRHFEDSIRAGYYDADIGYDDVPAGEAMLQFDCFPFSIEPVPSVNP